ncbi:hypothetical protein [Rubritalea marina]|uniref:hypothetical protein n=1 Tax=Rubritalea marina TaxID=361055 RepID=UPI0014613861|nr:hypothetical protein [Rubritalea marina]
MIIISVLYPFLRGMRRVHWLRSVALGWAFFVAGCVFREHLGPWLAGALIGEGAREEVQCVHSYMILGVALGWIFPLVFHGLGLWWGALRERRAV